MSNTAGAAQRNRINRRQIFEAAQQIEAALPDISQEGLFRRVIAAYVLYKVSIWDSLFPVDYAEILSEDLRIPEFLRKDLVEYLPGEVWQQLHGLPSRYEAEVFAEIVLLPEEMGKKLPTSLLRLTGAIRDQEQAGPSDEMGNFYLSMGLSIPNTRKAEQEFAPLYCIVTLLRAEILCDIHPEYTKELLRAEDTSHLRDYWHTNLPTAWSEERKWFLGYLIKIHTFYSEWVVTQFFRMVREEGEKQICLFKRKDIVGKLPPSRIRQYIQKCLREGQIQSLVFLPAGTIPWDHVVLVIFHHNQDMMRVVDATEIGTRNDLGWIEWEESQIQWILEALRKNAERSWLVEKEELPLWLEDDEILSFLKESHKQVENAVPFADVIREIVDGHGTILRGQELKALITKEETGMRLLTWDSIHEGIIDEELPNIEQIPEEKCTGSFLHDRELVFFCVENMARPMAIFSAQKGEKAIGWGNMFFIQIDEQKVDPYYLCAFFNSRAGRKILEPLQRSKWISADEVISLLKEISVPLPSLEEQTRVGERYKRKLQDVRDAQRALRRSLERLDGLAAEQGKI